MSAPTAIAFDVDGVLVDTDRLHFDALNHALMLARAHPITPGEHASVFKGLPTRVKLDMLVAQGRLAERKRATVAEVKQIATREALAALPRNDAALALIRELKKAGVRLCAVSNAIRESVDLMLTAAGVAWAMDFYLGNEDAPPKPLPDLYVLAAQRLGVTPADLVAVEDGAPGIAAATAAGCRVVAVYGPAEVSLALWGRLIEA